MLEAANDVVPGEDVDDADIYVAKWNDDYSKQVLKQSQATNDCHFCQDISQIPS